MGSINPERRFTLEFYDDPGTGKEPVVEWMRKDLSGYHLRALTAALELVLARYGIDVCRGEYGKTLGQGLFEFRLRHNATEIIRKHTEGEPAEEARSGKIVLRVFCHAYGQRAVLLLGGYDKAADPGQKRQQKEIEVARKRRDEFRTRRSTQR